MTNALFTATELFNTGEWEYGQLAPGRDTDGDGKKEIDCSRLVSGSLQALGYNIPYLTTTALSKPSIQAKYFDLIVNPEDVQQGDIALFHGHVGIVAQFDATTGVGGLFHSIGQNLTQHVGGNWTDDRAERGPRYNPFCN
jgi:cell wall-associated NlpC family hydrolase